MAGDGEAQRLEAVFQVLGGGGHALGIAGAGLDVDQLLQRLDDGRLLVGGSLEQRLVALLGESRGREGDRQQAGEQVTLNAW